jgi:hypothetical protein
MMKNMPEGYGRCCQVTWEKEKKTDEEKTNTT